MCGDFKENRKALGILDKLSQQIDLGLKSRVMQSTPHLVLLSKPFYHEKIKPLLTDWTMLWLRTKRLTGLENQMVKEYLLKGSKSSAKCQEAVRTNLSDLHIKLLNICHDWLRSFLPHVRSVVAFITLSQSILSTHNTGTLKNRQSEVWSLETRGYRAIQCSCRTSNSQEQKTACGTVCWKRRAFRCFRVQSPGYCHRTYRAGVSI